MSAKDEKRANQDLQARLEALTNKKPAPDPAPLPVTPASQKVPHNPLRPKPIAQRETGKSSPKSLCHYMYVSPEEDRIFKRQVGRFIGITAETMAASEVLRVMMFVAAEASEEQIIAAYDKAIQGDGKRMG